ncbi:MAG TPA: hypothetical protein DGT23_31285 [Micromonosporaceae bacterium]|nr:hypothetical protein [Micromonosporaceae bacterium]
MRDLAQAPPLDFVSYVERRLPALDSATHRLTGDDIQAERLARELLTLVAVRWGRLRRSDAKQSLPEGQSADGYLGKLFRQEADELGYPQMMLRLDAVLPTRRRPGPMEGLRPAEEAELIWERGRRTVRRRLLLAGVAGGILALVAICQRRGGSSSQPESESTPAPRTTVLPTGAERAPAEVTGTRAVRGIPAEVVVPSEDRVELLSAMPLSRALLLAAASRADTSSIFVLGDDGKWRKVDGAPALANLWLQTSALSPDGTRAAFGTSTGTVVIDLTTGRSSEFHSAPETTRPVWLGPQYLLLAPNSLVDPATGKASAVPEGPEDTVTPRRPLEPLGDPLARLLQLLSVGQPATAPARLRWWVPSADGLQQASVPLNGPLTELIGPWRGPGFGIDGDIGLVVRACVPSAVPSVAQTSVVVAVVRPKTGRVERALLVDSGLSGNVRLVGWADERRVLLSLIRPGRQQIVAWDLVAGGLSVVSEVNSDGVVSLPELSWVA